MLTKDKILKIAKTRSSVRTHELVKKLKLSRQTVAHHLKTLVNAGNLTKTGSTRNATYAFARKPVPIFSPEVKMTKKARMLEEDRVFEEVSKRLNLKKNLSPNVWKIAYYSFYEMLNNAIDHSRSASVNIHVQLNQGKFLFTIRDFGIGVFKNVKHGFHLHDEFEAAEHVFKGKQTTDPARHSGQGIFFTSRIADLFSLRSHLLSATVDNDKQDTYFSSESNLKGTLVSFSIRQRSRKNLNHLFKEFANEDFDFDKNQVRVKLRRYSDLVSRSQARRLLNGLESFKRITFDFKGIRGMGQAYADEIFRVFANRHPTIKIDYENANSAVEFMIRRALSK